MAMIIDFLTIQSRWLWGNSGWLWVGAHEGREDAGNAVD